MKTDWQVIGLLLVVLATVSANPDLEWSPTLIVVAFAGFVFMLAGIFESLGGRQG